MNKNRDFSESSIKQHKKAWRLCLFAAVCMIAAWIFGADISLRIYKNKVKRYIETQEFSKETTEILYAAVHYIRYPENISDYKMMSLTRADQLKGARLLITADGSEKEMPVDEDDWLVVIGDPALHRYYNAIIDHESLEYLGSIPIA